MLFLPHTKIKILKEIYDVLLNSEFNYKGICDELYINTALYGYELSSKKKIKKIFKLNKFQPSYIKSEDAYWFRLDEAGKIQRITIINKLIKYWSLPWYKRIFYKFK